jgi:twitching motility protein PilT
MQVGQEKFGMQTLNQCLYALYQKKLISQEEALNRATEVDELKMMMEGRTAQQIVLGGKTR